MSRSPDCGPKDAYPGNGTLHGLDTSMNYCFMGGSNSSDPRMIECCAPNHAETQGGCYEWCEIPQRYFDNSDGTQIGVMNAFNMCLQSMDEKTNMSTTSLACNLPDAAATHNVAFPGFLPFVVLWMAILKMVF